MVEFDPSIVLLAAELARATAGRADVCVGCPLGLRRTPSLIALVPPPLERLPLDLAEVQLVVLHAHSGSLLRQCAVAGVREVWITTAGDEARDSPVHQALERLTYPVSGRYRGRTLVLPGDSLSLIALPEVTFTPLPTCRRPA